MTGWFPRLWQRPSAVLLAAQLIGVLLYPFMDESPVGRAALSLFSLLVLFLAVRAVRASPALLWVALLLGLPIVVLTILEIVDPLNSAVILGRRSSTRSSTSTRASRCCATCSSTVS